MRLIFVVIFLKCLILQAQVKLENFTKDNVLTSNQITCYLVDSKGLVWVGTENGLNAYSAGKWYPIKAISNDRTGKEEQLGRVVKIFEDSRRNIWVSTPNGIFIYNGNLWVHFLQEEDEKMTAKCFMEDRLGRIWIGFEKIKEFKEISSLQISIVSGIVYMYDYEYWYRHSEMSGSAALKYNEPPKYFTSFQLDMTGNIWITSLEGLFEFSNNNLVEFENADLKYIKFFGMLQANSGDIWVASEKGVFRLHDGTWLNYTKKDGLSGDFFYDIDIDPQGRIWAFSANDMKFNGLSMYNGEKWQQFDNDAIHLKGDIENLIWCENEVLAFSTDGVSYFDNTGWHRFDKKGGLPGKNYSIMARDRYKNIWLASENGFYQYENKKWVKLYEPASGWFVNQVYTDKKKMIWLATANSGVFHYNNDNWEQLTVENGLPDDCVSGVFEDKSGDIWFITKKGVAKTNISSE